MIIVLVTLLLQYVTGGAAMVESPLYRKSTVSRSLSVRPIIIALMLMITISHNILSC